MGKKLCVFLWLVVLFQLKNGIGRLFKVWLNAKTRLFCIFLGKDCSKPEDEERNVPHSTEL